MNSPKSARPAVLPQALGLLVVVAALAGCGRDPGNGAPDRPVDRGEAAAVGFRDGVLAIAREELPAFELEASLDPSILRHGDAEIGLTNLRAKCAALAGPGADFSVAGSVAVCRGVVREHLETVRAALGAPAVAVPETFAEAAPRLRPQLAPAAYVATLHLASRPFAADLVTALVLDAEKNFRYVTEDDAKRWGVDFDALLERAIANLEAASGDLPLQATELPDALVAVETGDGYDATRLLLPGLRQWAAERVGSPFYAAIPTRDVLVMWSKGGSAPFQNHLRAEIGTQFRNEPYPLSDRIWEVGPDGPRPLAE